MTFELEFKDVSGMECTNSLIEDFSRLVFEARHLKKRDFERLEDFFRYYDLHTEPKNHYRPILNRKEGRIQVRTAWNSIN